MVTRVILINRDVKVYDLNWNIELMGNVRKISKLHLREVQVLYNQIEKVGLFRYFLNPCNCGSPMSKYSTRVDPDTRF